ncbi:MAG TPA: hybrid sensor histidine kinase/response regulator, partial [Solimonas sp.]|nr:hybrid sensor histidine kinase/response regulator [Solimonas sp.]
MLKVWELFAVSAAYVGVLFAIAYVGDQRAAGGAPARGGRWIYSLALGVYCTSWTFYGAVGRAATSGWDFLPIYLGPILVFVFGAPLIGRIVAISKRHNITSIADFIGARYGRHQPLSMLVTLIAVIGVLPYIALQLKAVAFSFDVLAAPTPTQAGQGVDNALVIAALLAMFSILFGTRQVVSSENHHGMVLAIAFESVIKLLAFLAIGLYAVYGLYQGPADAYAHALALPQVTRNLDNPVWLSGFATQTLLAAAAIVCLPRQFHVTVVENTAPADLATARWVFPLYLALISLFVLPIAAAGLEHLPAGVRADTYVLALPMSGQHGTLALVAYLGGFSAATSMVIVATIALSTMLCNEVVMPLLLRWRALGLARRSDLSGLLKAIRRAAIVALVLLAYLYYRNFTGPGTLASIGLLSFAAVLQFTPALVGGLYWRRGAYPGAVAGICIGFALWLYTLLLPILLPSGWLEHGPLGIAALRPQALFGLTGLDPVTHSTLWSLAGNLLAYVGVSLLAKPGLHERLQAARFLGLDPAGTAAPGAAP